MFKSNKRTVGLITLLAIGFILVQQVSPLASQCFAGINDDNVRIGIKSINDDNVRIGITSINDDNVRIGITSINDDNVRIGIKSY